MSTDPTKAETRTPHIVLATLGSALFFFLVLAAYYVIRPVREQLGAAAGGSAVLPWIWLQVFVVMLAATPVYGMLVAKLSPRRFIPIVYLFFASGMILWALFLPEKVSRGIATSFYVWVGVFNLYVVAVFWSFMTDVFTSEQAKRLFGPIAIGGTAGALAGPLFAGQMVAHVGVPGLLVASAILLSLSIPLVPILVGWSKQHGRRDANHENPIGGNLLAGAKALFANPFLLRMALLLVLSDMIATVLYSLVSDVAGQMFSQDAVARTQFFASIDMYANLTQFLLQAFVVRFLLVHLGANLILVLVGLANAMILVFLALIAWEDGFIPLILTRDLGIANLAQSSVLVLALIGSRALAYGLANPARESLFARVDREERYKAKSFIDTVVWRGGDTVASFGLRAVQLLGAGIGHIALFGVGFALTSAWLARNVHQLRGLKDPGA